MRPTFLETQPRVSPIISLHTRERAFKHRGCPKVIWLESSLCSVVSASESDSPFISSEPRSLLDSEATRSEICEVNLDKSGVAVSIRVEDVCC